MGSRSLQKEAAPQACDLCLVGEMGFTLTLRPDFDYSAEDCAGDTEVSSDELTLNVGALPLKFTR